MACSNCGAANHRIQTCPTVRRCGHCHRHGHDRRNCPRLSNEAPPALPAERPPRPPTPPTLAPDDPVWGHIARLRPICARDPDLLAHLYWPRNESYFEASRAHHAKGGSWRLTATTGHGLHSEDHPWPTLNFFVATVPWLITYQEAAVRRGIRHGVLLRRTAIQALSQRRGFDFAEVTPRYPGAGDITNPGDFWKFDIGKRRFAALDVMQHANVVRLATPAPESARCIDVPGDAIVASW